MKPMIVLPPNTMSKEDIEALRANDICVVVSKDPSKVKFVDPIPAVAQRGKIEMAAIKLSRLLISGRWGNYTQSNQVDRADICRIYVDMLVEGTPLDERGTIEERVDRAYENEKLEEAKRLARADAKAEREAAKAKKAAAQTKS